MTTPLRPYPEPFEGLEVVRDDRVLRITLARPARRNAITDDMVQALIGTVEAAGADEDVRVIRLGGQGDDFCSGFDLAGRSKPDTPPRTGATQRRMRFQVNELVPTLLETQTPIVAAVRGRALGLGFALTLASDLAVVADDATFAAPFVRSGFTPDSGMSWLLPRLVGVARAKELVLLGRRIDGRRAAEIGLVTEAVPADEVDAAADALVAELAEAATVAVGLGKLLVHRALTADLDRHLADEALAIELASRSADFAEWSRAMRDGRDPDFTGR